MSNDQYAVKHDKDNFYFEFYAYKLILCTGFLRSIRNYKPFLDIIKNLEIGKDCFWELCMVLAAKLSSFNVVLGKIKYQKLIDDVKLHYEFNKLAKERIKILNDENWKKICWYYE